ncbi:O-methyltransferase [Colletotrichum tabaci]|uniref:O-methyltransferase n=1 Tax=Colletotrichum tabaci TaxID=1209068 RepID=A0AAV9T1Y2_9PEZI
MGSVPERTPIDVSVAVQANDAKGVAELSDAVGSLGRIFSPENEEGSLQLLKQTSGYSCIVGGCWPTFRNFPSYLKKHNWSIPADQTEGPLQDVVGKNSNFFKHMMTNYPGGEFQSHMAGLIRGADGSADAAFLVDIGGSIGHDLDEFCRKHPGAPGRHIL